MSLDEDPATGVSATCSRPRKRPLDAEERAEHDTTEADNDMAVRLAVRRHEAEMDRAFREMEAFGIEYDRPLPIMPAARRPSAHATQNANDRSMAIMEELTAIKNTPTELLLQGRTIPRIQELEPAAWLDVLVSLFMRRRFPSTGF